jgi:hypothetical protein
VKLCSIIFCGKVFHRSGDVTDRHTNGLSNCNSCCVGLCSCLVCDISGCYGGAAVCCSLLGCDAASGVAQIGDCLVFVCRLCDAVSGVAPFGDCLVFICRLCDAVSQVAQFGDCLVFICRLCDVCQG